MTLRVSEDDNRSPLLAGKEDILVDQVLRKRDCVFTNKCCPLQNFRTLPSFPRLCRSTTKEDALYQIYHDGRLCCRVVYIRFTGRTGKDTSGIVRHLHSDEIDVDPASSSVGPGSSRGNFLIIEDDDEEEAVVVTGGTRTRGKRRARSDSIETLEAPPRRKSSLPTKKKRYTFADVFCGAGGASQGAAQAGLHVLWGLDNNEDALNAYRSNHTGALPFCQNAHHFPPGGFTEADLRVDVLHLSPPCCYWSPAQ